MVADAGLSCRWRDTDMVADAGLSCRRRDTDTSGRASSAPTE